MEIIECDICESIIAPETVCDCFQEEE